MSALFRATKAADFDRLYRRHAPSVYRYAYAVLGNQADAEDVTQQTFLNAYRAIADGTKPRKAENWLLRIAHNELRRHFRTNGRAVEVEFDERLAQPVPESSEPSLADVLRALRQLPPIQRSALVMREFEGRSYAEIAEVLDVSQSALEALIFRARRGLAEYLEGALTCTDAEQALSRRLDGRLARREARRLKEHLHECAPCARFAGVQKRQRSLLKGLSVMPVPASLFLFRGEPAAAALGASAVAVGGSSAVGGTATGAGAGGLAAGLFAKAAAVTAAAAVAGGVGYDVATGPAHATKTGGEVADAAAVAKPPAGGRTQLLATTPSEHQLASGSSAVSRAPGIIAKAKVRPAKRAPQAGDVTAEKRPARSSRLRGKAAFVVKTRPARTAAKSSAQGTRTRTRGTNRPAADKRQDTKTKPPRPAGAAEKPKPPRVAEPPPASNAVEPAGKKPHD